MAKRANAITLLAEQLLQQLEAARGQTGDAYPLTVRLLAERIDPVPPEADVLKAVARKPFADRAVVAK